MNENINIRTLVPSDVKFFRELRLFGLQESPSAFAQTAEEFEAMREDELLSWIRESEDRFSIGAFDKTVMVGFAGVRRETRAKVRHKAIIWGVYMLPEYRGKGIALNLMSELIQRAKTSIPGLQQLLLNVSQTQIAAANLYQKLNFRTYGREPQAMRIEGEYLSDDLMWLDFGSDE